MIRWWSCAASILVAGCAMTTENDVGAAEVALEEPIEITTDTFLDSFNTALRDQNFGSETSMLMDSCARPPLQAPQSTISSTSGGAPVLSGTLRVFNSGSAATVHVHRVTVPWQELTTTWNCPTELILGNGVANCQTPPGPW